jgi:hypothetical protein
MAKNWVTVLAVKGTLWGVTDAEKAELADHVQDAEAALTKAKSEETRTPVATAQCKAAFDALVKFMRNMKKRHFLSPPLVPADYVSLGLDPSDTTYSRRGVPKAQMTAEIGRSGTGMLLLKLVYAEGTEALADPHTDIKFQVRHGKYNPANPMSNAAAGEIGVIPDNPLQLPAAFTTRRRREMIVFNNTDSGKTVYFDIRISNDTGVEDEGCGPWCPIFSSVIP